MIEKICGIYKIKNLANGKVYIGQSVDINNRWAVHISDFKFQKHANLYFQRAWNKYGRNNFEFSILEKCSKEELNDKEIYWIRQYNSNDNGIGYNLTSGGGSSIEYNTEYIERMREAQLSIPIIQLDLDGNIINIWNHGAREASKKLGFIQCSIWKCVNGLSPTYEKFIWMEHNEYLKDGVDLSYYENKMRFKRIVQLSYDGNTMIKVWDNTKSINSELGYDTCSITKVCRGVNASLYGYKWMYYIDYKNNKFNNKIPTRKRVVQLSMNGKLIKYFDSFIDAERELNIHESGIRACCNGKYLQAGGYKWMLLNEYNQTENIA